MELDLSPAPRGKGRDREAERQLGEVSETSPNAPRLRLRGASPRGGRVLNSGRLQPALASLPAKAHTRHMKLYQTYTSPFPTRVRLVLYAKGLEPQIIEPPGFHATTEFEGRLLRHQPDRPGAGAGHRRRPRAAGVGGDLRIPGGRLPRSADAAARPLGPRPGAADLAALRLLPGDGDAAAVYRFGHVAPALGPGRDRPGAGRGRSRARLHRALHRLRLAMRLASG